MIHSSTICLLFLAYSLGVKTMYGGVTEPFVEEMIQRACITHTARFIDVGSGIGQVRYSCFTHIHTTIALAINTLTPHPAAPTGMHPGGGHCGL